VPRLVADWKQSTARGGARTALTLVKAHYPKVSLDLVTSGIPESDDNGTLVNKAAIWQSMLGYDQLCAMGTKQDVYYKAYDLPRSPSHASTSISGAADAADGGDGATSAVTKPGSTIWQKKQCINSAPEWVCNITDGSMLVLCPIFL
jgi:hypothetical protein